MEYKWKLLAILTLEDIKIFREGENQRCIELTPIGKNYETIGKVL